MSLVAPLLWLRVCWSILIVEFCDSVRYLLLFWSGLDIAVSCSVFVWVIIIVAHKIVYLFNLFVQESAAVILFFFDYHLVVSLSRPSPWTWFSGACSHVNIWWFFFNRRMALACLKCELLVKLRSYLIEGFGFWGVVEGENICDLAFGDMLYLDHLVQIICTVIPRTGAIPCFTVPLSLDQRSCHRWSGLFVFMFFRLYERS